MHSITRRDFRTKFPRDFYENVRETYEQKRTHREGVFEKHKASSLTKEDYYKNENIYCLQNVNMNDIVARPAIHGLSRHIQRENKNIIKEDPILKSITASPRPQNLLHGIRTGINYIET